MQFNFNAANHTPRVAGGSSTIPRGKYPVVLAAAEEKPNSAKTGSYIEASFFVTDGEYRGRKVINRYNTNNPNPTAVEMALNEIAALSLACGVPSWQHFSQLFNRPLILDVDIEEGKWTNPQNGQTRDTQQNRIAGYYTAQGIDATTLAQGGGAPAQQQSAPPAWVNQQQPPAGPAPAPAAMPASAPPWAGGAPAPAPAAAAAPGGAPAPMAGGFPAPAGTGQQPPWNNGGGQPMVQPQQPPWNGQPQQAQPQPQQPPWANGAAQPSPAGPPPWQQGQG